MTKKIITIKLTIESQKNHCNECRFRKFNDCLIFKKKTSTTEHGKSIRLKDCLESES